MTSTTERKKDMALWFLFLGYGSVTTGFKWDYDSMTVLALKQKLAYLWYLECEPRRIRLYQARRIDEDDTVTPHTSNDWLCISDAEADELSRIDFFPEIRRKFTQPTLEMRDDRMVSEYFNASTVWPPDLRQLHVLVKVPSKCQRIWCVETERREKPKVALALQREGEAKEKAERVGQQHTELVTTTQPAGCCSSENPGYNAEDEAQNSSNKDNVGEVRLRKMKAA